MDVKSGAHTNLIQIPITHVTLDVLHLFRVTDILCNLLIMDIRRQDSINNENYLRRLESFLNNDCHNYSLSSTHFTTCWVFHL